MQRLWRIEDLRTWRPGVALLLASIAALAFTSIWFATWPTDLMWDDGGIVLRYMDNFADGHPFRYNADGPPVFGVSGFVHFMVAGAVAASGWLSPEDSVHFSGFVGLVLSCVAMAMILRRFTESLLMLVVGWAFAVTACYSLLVNAFQGLESSLHLGIVLMTVWAFLADRWRAMWALMALSIVSKLDAVPVVAVLVVLRATSLRSRAEWVAEIRRAAIWGGIPLLTWILLATWYFGSPIPEPATVKYTDHYHPPRPIDFVVAWWEWDPIRIVGYWSFIVAGVVWAARRRRDLAQVLALPLGCVAVLALYVVYNPGERMPWYYVLPQALLVLGAVCGLFRVLRDQRRVAAVLIVVLGLGAALPTTINRAERRIRDDLNYIRGIEPERIAIGRFIHENALPEDRLLTGHGYVARYARIHTHDSTGLNSPEVTRLRAERKYLPDALHPEWIAWHAGLPWDTQREFGYRLERTYYARSARGNPAWRVWHRAPGPLALVAITEDIQGGEIQTGPDRLAVSSISPIRLQLRRDFPVEGLEFGIVRVEDPTTIRVLNGDQVMADRTIPPRDWDEPVTGGSVGFRVDVPDPSLPVEIRVTAADGSPVPKEFIVLEPVWLITRETGAR